MREWSRGGGSNEGVVEWGGEGVIRDWSRGRE